MFGHDKSRNILTYIQADINSYFYELSGKAASFFLSLPDDNIERAGFITG